jgi:plasmid stabilization system protein ParE
MNYVTWRKRARTDFTHILEYTENEWGYAQAGSLVRVFETALATLVESPLIGRESDHLNSRALVLSEVPFVILYQVRGNEVIVRQIIHMSKRR